MKAQFKNSTGFEAAKPSVGGRRETVKISDLVEMLEWPKKGKGVTVRLVGPIAGRGIHKIKVRKKDGNEVEIQKPCLAYNPKTDDKDSTVKCPYCKMPAELAKFSKLYFGNAIVRELQEDKPGKLKRPTKGETETGFKEMDSDTWTPVRVVRIPSSLMLRIKQLGEKNIVKSKTGDKKHFFPMHEKFGFDLDITFDKTLPAASMYSADRTESPDGEKYSVLTEDEGNYLLWDTDQVYPAEEFEEAKKEAKSLQDRWGGDKDEDDEDEDDDEPKSRKKPLSKAKHVDDDDEDDMDLDDEDDEDDAPKKSSKKPAAKGKKPADDEDDDEDDLDLDDDDEDDEPPKKSSKKPAAKGKKPVASDDDDEDDDEDDEDDEDDDEPPKKSSKKPVAKGKKPAADDEDDEDDEDLDDLDEDDEDDEEDEDDEPPKKSSKKPVAKKPAAKGKKPADDEDDEEDEDDSDDLDDEEEEEAPPKRTAKKPAAKSVSVKRKSR